MVKVVAGSNTEVYTNDALGRRVTMKLNSNTATDLYFSSAWQVLEEDQGGVVQEQNLWAPDYVDDLVARTPLYSQGSYVQQDAKWNVTSLADLTGTVQEYYSYDPYGKVSFYDRYLDQFSSSQYGMVYLFQGGRFDTTSGLYNFQNRDLSPTLGRWMQEDPAGYVGSGPDLYGYEGDNAATNGDPMGLGDLGQNSFKCGISLLSAIRSLSARSDSACCSDAQKIGLDKLWNLLGDIGGVICCDGRKVTCFWGSSVLNTTFDRIFKNCVLAHEASHMSDFGDCPNKIPSLDRPPFKPGVDFRKAECDAYAISISCLFASISSCDTPRCRALVVDEYNRSKAFANTAFGCGFKWVFSRIRGSFRGILSWGAGTRGSSFPPPTLPTLLPSLCSGAGKGGGCIRRGVVAMVTLLSQA